MLQSKLAQIVLSSTSVRLRLIKAAFAFFICAGALAAIGTFTISGSVSAAGNFGPADRSRTRDARTKTADVLTNHLTSSGDVPDGLTPADWPGTLSARGSLAPAVLGQEAYLKPTAFGSTQADDRFGYAVAVAGDTAVIGAYLEDSSTTGVNSTADEISANSGAAYVFTRTAGVWTQQAYLKPAAVGATQDSDSFGISVAISGDTIVVGALLEDSGTTGVNGTADESSPNSGAVYVFTRMADVWTQQAFLKPDAVGTTQANDFFGTSVAVSGDTVVVGAYAEDSGSTGINSTPDESSAGSGAAYIFTRTAGVWTQQAYLKPAAIGTAQADDRFGVAVAAAGDTVVVTAINEDSSTTGVNGTADEGSTNSGAAYVFTRAAGVWTQQAYLKPAAVGSTQQNDRFGISVAVSGDTVVVGADFEDSSTTGVGSPANEISTNSGAAYVFARTAGVWTQQEYLKPASVGTTQDFDNFGRSVAVSGDTIVVGALFEDSGTTGINSSANESATNSGAAYLFTRTAGVWSQQAYLKPTAVGVTQQDDWFGFSVAAEGGTVAVGALSEDSGTTGVNSTANETSTNSGAAYVVSNLGTTAANVAVSGVVMTSDGRGLRNATVLLTDVQGNTRRAITSSFGYYRFEDVEAGQTYVIGVASKRYVFTPRTISVADELTDVDLVGQ